MKRTGHIFTVALLEPYEVIWIAMLTTAILRSTMALVPLVSRSRDERANWLPVHQTTDAMGSIFAPEFR